MKKIIEGSFESSREMIRRKHPSPKGRLDWRGQAAQVCIKFIQNLAKRKSEM
jgi:hypothetical protein